MLMNGLDGQITTARRRRVARAAARKSGCGARRRRAGKDDLAHRRLAAPPHEIILEIEPALAVLQTRVRTGSSLIGRMPRGDAEPAAEIVGDRRQRLAGGEPAGALDMGREIAVAEPEPGLAAERFERRHEGPGLVAPAPAGLRIVEPGEGVEQACRYRARSTARDARNRRRYWRRPSARRAAARGRGRAPAWRRRSPPDSASTRPAVRRSSEQVLLRRADQVGGRRFRRGPGEAAHQHHRHRLRRPGPCSSEAAAAISSAKPISVTSQLAAEQVGLAAQIDQRRQPGGADRDADRAAAPRPAEAVADDDARSARRRRSIRSLAQDRRPSASGSTGSSSTRSAPSSGATLEWSMPALAITKPSRCSTIIRSGRCRTTRRDSDRTTSTRRGSLSISAASAIASRRRRRRWRDRHSGPRPWRRSSARPPARRRARDAVVLDQRGDRERGEIVARLDHRHAARPMISTRQSSVQLAQSVIRAARLDPGIDVRGMTVSGMTCSPHPNALRSSGSTCSA